MNNESNLSVITKSLLDVLGRNNYSEKLTTREVSEIVQPLFIKG